MLIEKQGSDYIVTGPMEISDMIELNKAVTESDDETMTVLPPDLRESFQSLKELPIDNLVLKMPLGPTGSSTRLR